MYNEKRKLKAMLACLAVVIIALFSTFFIAGEANHQCSGQDCPICACIQEAEKALRGMGCVIAVLVCVLAPILFLSVCLTMLFVSLTNLTPVSQKIRLNN